MSLLRNILLLGTVIPLAACGADDVASPGEGGLVIVAPPAPPPPPPPPPPPATGGPAASCPEGTANVGIVANRRNCQISGVITGNRIVQNLPGVIYSLSGRVDVGRDLGGDGNLAGGAQGILTVEPGVVIFGSSGADFLVVNRGSQIFAEGSATQPIIFTSRQNVEGQTGPDSIGQWGGLVLLGRAPIQRCIGNVAGGSVGCQSQVEGTSNAFYGGASPNDNSGRLRYVQVRYPGFEISPGNELNGITLGGVGNGTTIEYVQVHNSSDDGFEWFGGTVNQRYIIVTGADDDSLDTDFGFKGYIQFAIVVQRATGGDKIIEADTTGNGNATPRSHPRIANATMVGRTTNDAIHMRGGTDFTLVNSIVTGSPICLRVDEAVTVQPANAALDERGPPRFESVFFGCPTPFRDRADVTAAQIEQIFGSGSNNVARGTSTLQNVFVNGPNERAVTPFAAASLNTTAPQNALNPASGNFFVNTNYIGAVRDNEDLWFQGWACGMGFNTPSCAASPVPAGA